MTLVSRVLGLVRDVVIAPLVRGATAATGCVCGCLQDSRIFSEGCLPRVPFSLAFVPVLAEYRERGDQAALKSLIDATAGTLLAVLLVITAIGVLAAPWVISLFAARIPR